VPKANAGTGAPGTSLLAAPADHVHPASEESSGNEFVFDDASQQSVTGTTPEVVCEFVVDFGQLDGDHFGVQLTALVKASAGPGRFRVLVGGTPGRADGRELVGIAAVAPDFEVGGVLSEGFEKPNPLFTLIKIVGSTDQPSGVTHIRAKSAKLRGMP
jgi:hypothetical protein